MKKKRPPPNPTDELRARAERFLAKADPEQKKIFIEYTEDVGRLVHELQVHQIELEMQNEELRRAQETIEVARSRYEALYDIAPVGYFTLDHKGKIIEVNLTGAGLFGLERNRLVNQPLFHWVAPESWEAFRVHLQEVFKTGGHQTCELKFLRHDGTHLDVLIEITALPDSTEMQRQCHAVISDITARKQAENALEKSEASYRTLAENLPGVVYRVHLQENNRMEFFNDMVETMTGFLPSELCHGDVCSIDPLIHPEDRAHMISTVKRALENNQPFEVVYCLRHKSGLVHYLMERGRPVRGPDGQMLFIDGVIIDITARKQLEKDLQESEARFRHIASTISDIPFSCTTQADGSYAIDWMVGAAERITGYSVEEIKAQRCIRFMVIEEDLPLFEKHVTGLAAGSSGTCELRLRHKDGGVVWVASFVKCVKENEQPQGLRLFGGLMDITARKRAEAEVKLNEARLASLLRVSQYPATSIQDLLDYALDEAIALTGSESGCIYFYDEATQQLTLNTCCKEVMKQCPLAEDKTIYQLEKTGIWGEAFRQARPIVVNDFQAPHPLKKGYPAGHAKLHKYLTVPIWSNNRIVAVAGMANKPTDYEETEVRQLTLMMDVVWKIVTRIQAEEALKLSEKKFRTLYDKAPLGYQSLDGDGVIIEVNQTWLDLLGYSREEVVGRWFGDFLAPGFVERFEENFPCFKEAGKIFDIQLEMERKDGSLIAVSFNGRIAYNEDGQFLRTHCLFSDITARRLAEEKVKNLNTLLQTIKEINTALLQVKSEPELFQQTCDLLLGVPHVKFSWIGLVQPDSHEIKPVAWAGAEEGYLSIIKVAWGDSEYGRGPTGQAIRTAQPVVRKNLNPDPYPHPWKEEALKRGYHSSITLPLIHEGEVIGILKGYAGVPDAFGEQEIEFLNQVAGDIAVGIKSLRLEQEMIASLIKLQVMMIQTIEALAAMAELRDPYTAGHQQRVTQLALALAQEIGLAPDRTEGLRVASLIHDVGKIVVPAEILSRPGKISEYEMSMIRTHSQAGYDILNKIDFPWPVAQIVLQHHERLNGSGYPQGLQGTDILPEAKILAVADVVEAMASHRPYRPSLGIDKALEEITKNKGILYDPEVAEACRKLFKEKGFKLD